MKQTMKKGMPFLTVLAVLFLLSGCGEKTCHFVSPEAGEVEAGAPVEWHNATIGTVKSVQTVNDGFRVDITFDAAYSESIHDGVMARVENNPNFWPKPYVELLGAGDANRPVLRNGVRIPSLRSDNVTQEKIMRVDDWLTIKNITYAGLIVLAVPLFKILGKRISSVFRGVLKIAFLALMGYVAWTLWTDWEAHRERFSNLKHGVMELLEQKGDFLKQNDETIKNVGTGLEVLDSLVEDE
jgi:hypothetical protein